MGRFVVRAIRAIENIFTGGLLLTGLGLLLVPLAIPDAAIISWLEEHLQDVLIGLLVALVLGGALVLGAIGRIEGQIRLEVFDRLRQRIKRRTAFREKLIVDELHAALDQVERFFDDGVLTIRAKRTFQDYWIKAIRAHLGSDLLATSLPSTNFFWNAEDAHAAMCDNITAGGSITRLFFLPDDDPPSGAVLAVMREHQKAGVEVCYCNKNRLPADERKLVMIDSRARFGWQVEVSTDDIKIAEIFSRKEDLEALRRQMTDLMARTELVMQLPKADASS